MSAASALAGSRYPERDEQRPGRLDKALSAARYFTGRGGTRLGRLRRIVPETAVAARGLEALSDAALLLQAAELRARLRRAGPAELALAARAFALVREAAGRSVGQRHFDEQLVGGWAMVNGMLAEMETGEGKTLTATLAAAAAALAGRAVHVVTVNDYLAERDAGFTRPIYEALGLTVGCVRQGMEPEARRAAYRCDITYCSNKELAFDYLRDRMVLGGKPRAIASRIEAMAGEDITHAIVDEADSVLVDEARTPLILSAQASQGQEEALHREALALAQQLAPEDYRIGVEAFLAKRTPHFTGS